MLCRSIGVSLHLRRRTARHGRTHRRHRWYRLPANWLPSHRLSIALLVRCTVCRCIAHSSHHLSVASLVCCIARHCLPIRLLTHPTLPCYAAPRCTINPLPHWFACIAPPPHCTLPSSRCPSTVLPVSSIPVWSSSIVHSANYVNKSSPISTGNRTSKLLPATLKLKYGNS